MEESEKRRETECQRTIVSRWVLGGLQELYEDRRHCDIEIKIQNETFSCHKVVLSAASKYFDAMFSSGLQESKSASIKLSDVSSEIFADILSFLYCGKDVIYDGNVEDLLKAASLLQMTCLQEQCEGFLIDQMCSENCIGLWMTAKSYICVKLQEAAWPFILEHFEELWENDEFVKIGLDDLVAIIKDDNLKISQEEIACQAALRWVKADEIRQNNVGEIVPHLRLSQVGLDFLLDEIYSNPAIYKNENSMKIVKDAVKYQALPDRRHTFKSASDKPRNTCAMTSLFVVIGRRQTSNGVHVTDVVGYDARNSKWYSLCSLPFDIGEEFTTCPYGDDIFISGGTVKPEVFLRFSAKQYRWLEKNSMIQGRYRHSMVAVKDSVFCLGGYYFGTLKCIEEFDIGSNSWQRAGELKHAVDAMSASVLGGRIYLFGGWLGFAEETNIIQCFDPTTQTCSVIARLPSPCKDSRALTFNKKSYIATANGEIYVFGQDHAIRVVDKINNFSKKNFGIFKDEHSLYLLGGDLIAEDSYDYVSKSCDQIVATNRNRSTLDSLPDTLPTSLDVYGCYKIIIKNKYPFIDFAEQFA